MDGPSGTQGRPGRRRGGPGDRPRQGQGPRRRPPSSPVEKGRGRAPGLTVQATLRAVRQSGPGRRGNARPGFPGRWAGHGKGDRVAGRQEGPGGLRALLTEGGSQSCLHPARPRLCRAMWHPPALSPAPGGPHPEGALPPQPRHPAAGGGLQPPVLRGPVLPRRSAQCRGGLEMEARRFPARLPSVPRFPRHGKKKSPAPLHGLHPPVGSPRGV